MHGAIGFLYRGSTRDKVATIRKHRSKWQAQVRIKGVKSITRSFAKKSEAITWSTITESEIRRGKFIDPRLAESITVADAIDRHLSELKSVDPARVSRCKRLKALLGAYSLAKLSNSHLAKYRDQRMNSVSPMTVIHELSILNRVLVLANTEWGVQIPGGIPRVQLPRKPPGRERRLSKEEESRLLAALEEEPLVSDIVIAALETGMRRGEVLNIQTNDYDLESRTLLIPTTKTGVPRTIPLSSRAAPALKRAETSEGQKCFPIASDRLHRIFKKACHEAGIEDFRFHDLRHEATSRFFELGLNTLEVAAITGHQSIEMLNRYTHPNPKDLAARLG